MKKFFTLFLVLSPFFMLAQLEVPNGDFEEWGYYNTWTLDPADWTTGNNQLFTHVEQDSMPFEAQWAMRVYPNTGFEPTVGVASCSFPANAIPPSLDFAVKCHIEELDSVSIKIQFINTDNNNWILAYENEWSSDSSIPIWESISMELDQIEPVFDLCQIMVQASYGDVFLQGNPETWISVDAMGFDTGTSLNESYGSPCKPRVKNNPVGESFEIVLDCPSITDHFTVTIIDLTGRVIEKKTDQLKFNSNEWPKGIYLYQISQSDADLYTGKVYKR